MRYLLIIGLFIFSHIHGISQDKNDLEATKKAVELEFDKRHVSLGDVIRGEVKETSFEFTNIGLDSIEIDLVSSCECTDVEYTRGKIAPGDKGILEVIFRSEEKEESETVDIDIILKNIDPESESQIFEILSYDFNLIQK